MTDHLADIKKYVETVDETVVAAMEKTYRLVLSKQDSASVSFSDPAELATVRENFLKKKLGVTGSDAELDAQIKQVGQQIHGRKDRLTVYYLLAEHYGKLDALK
ncbi:Protein of unknown function [Raineyella antarctica]|uniref:DUF2853 family protein n=1 Tax=Raineyella antarctica TaxID=1577474 RepID=A0A1G6GFQ3_9ACTN|nr:DUF2853 family protein [Raineyella antarctica]SDB80780.1 Protein of unknown function [Raineyella antarctica]